jgi:hypothetical protein
MDPSALLDLLNRGGVLALLALVILSGYKRVWVFGKELEDKQKDLDRLLAERDRLLDLALSATHETGRAVEHLARREERF